MTTIVTVDDYIRTQTAEAQPRLREPRAIIRAAAPQATEVISYGMPTYKLDGRRVHFGAAKRHCALYGSAIDVFTNELRDFKTLKGTVQFPVDRGSRNDSCGSTIGQVRFTWLNLRFALLSCAAGVARWCHAR